MIVFYHLDSRNKTIGIVPFFVVSKFKTAEINESLFILMEQYGGWFSGFFAWYYSHSMVAGGFELMS
jgi:hypothetical protein